jgi:probable rRNA maturation factor
VTVAVAWARGLRSRCPIGAREIAAAVEAALAHGRRAGASISVAIVGDAEIARLHARWFDDPTPTDVISFELGEEGGPAGELYVSLDTALRVAQRRGLDPAREVLLYAVHGTLHLCGFDDTSARERTRMRAAEATVLERIARSRRTRSGVLRGKQKKSSARRTRARRRA